MGWTRTLSVPSPALVEPVPGAFGLPPSTFLIAIAEQILLMPLLGAATECKIHSTEPRREQV
jgi:hypothetical protein